MAESCLLQGEMTYSRLFMDVDHIGIIVKEQEIWWLEMREPLTLGIASRREHVKDDDKGKTSNMAMSGAKGEKWATGSSSREEVFNKRDRGGWLIAAVEKGRTIVASGGMRRRVLWDRCWALRRGETCLLEAENLEQWGPNYTRDAKEISGGRALRTAGPKKRVEHDSLSA